MRDYQKEKPLLSIIIPSRNRQKYAISSIQSILNIDDNRIELVVHDNSDTNELEEFVLNNIKDPRLIYRYDATAMSTVHNFNKSMEYVSGDYLCFIGDDDGVNPEIIHAAYWAKENNLDAIVSSIQMIYLWPNTTHNGSVDIGAFTGSNKIIDVKKELKNFLKYDAVNYLKFNLPKIYHGIVRKECFDKVKNQLGYYFGGLSVDIFASISLALVAEKVICINYPLTIAGSSAASEQTHKTEEAKKLELKDAPHFRALGPYSWSDSVPSVYSGPTIWAESCIKALGAFGRSDLIELVNKFHLCAQISYYSPQHEKAILKEYLNKEDRYLVKIKYLFYKINIYLYNYYNGSMNRIAKIKSTGSSLSCKNIKNIEHAASVLNEYIYKSGINIKDVLHK